MDSIALNCPECKKSLKFPAARAGSNGECPHCGFAVPIPAPAAGDDEEDDGGTYGLVDVVEAQKTLPVAKKKESKPLDPSLRKKKKLQDAGKLNVIRGGLAVMSTAAGVWGVVYALQMAVVLYGCTRGSEYNPARIQILLGINDAKDLEPDENRGFNRIRFALALLYGSDKYLTVFQIVQTLLALVSIFPIVLFLIGYVTCSRPPHRIGMPGQVKALMLLAPINIAIIVLFRVLPLIGTWGPMPFIVPEVPTLSANAERFMPIHVAWMQLPYLEVLLTLLFIGVQFAEFTLGAVFLYSIGYTIKEDELRDAGMGLVQLAMGTGLAFVVYHLFTLAGCSEMLISVLRIIYLAAVGFQFFFIFRYLAVLNLARTTLAKRMEGLTEEELQPKEEDDEYEEDDDEEEEEERDRKKKRQRRRDDEDDDDGRMQRRRKRDIEEGIEEDRPAKRKKR